MKKSNLKKLGLKKEVVARLDKPAMTRVNGGINLHTVYDCLVTSFDNCITQTCNSDFAACGTN